MAKPATRMKSVVLKSFCESLTRLAGSLSPGGAAERDACDALGVCCDQPEAAGAQVSCSPALRAELRATIEDMVIPRLVIGQCLPPSAAPRQHRGRVLPTSSEVDLLARMAAQPDLERALELAFGMLSAGLSLETVLLHLIGPAARRLGTDWEEDLRSFADVTVGLGTLHELVHLLVRRDARDALGPSALGQSQEGTELAQRTALLVPGPGEQHTLGLYIFAELLRHSRWTVTLETNMPNNALLDTLRAQSIDAVGIAVSSSERFAAVVELIRSVRRASRNQAVRVVIGGPVDLTREAASAGVSYCSDARSAVDWLDGE